MPPYGWIILAASVALYLVAWIGDITPWDFTSLRWFFLFVVTVSLLMRQRELHR